VRRTLLTILAVAAMSGCDEWTVRPKPAPKLADRPFTAASVKPFAMGRPDLVLLVTGGSNGMMETCNCPGPMPGGLARRSGLARSYRAAFDSVFMLDCGDMFWVEPSDLRNGYVLQGYGQIGYDAVVLGDQEWASDTLATFLKRGDLTYLASNVAKSRLAPHRSVTSVVTRQFGRAKLAVLSYLAPKAFRFTMGKAAENFPLRDLAHLAKRIDTLQREGHVVVVVVHGEVEEVEQVAADSGADLVIRGHTTRCAVALRRVGTTPVAKIGGYQYVGVLAMKVSGGGQIDAIEYRVELVTEHWPLDTRLIQTYQAYAHVAMREALDVRLIDGLKYVPSATCGACHKKQFAAWSASAHARAYKTLQRAGRTGDPNCITCHTTGFGTKSGFYTLAKTPKLANVNCQDCHRFNITDDHKSKSFASARRRVDDDVCTTCHTPITDPPGRYEKSLGAKPFPHR